MQIKCFCICRLTDGQVLVEFNRTGAVGNLLIAARFSSRYFHQNRAEMNAQQEQQWNYEPNRTMLHTANEGFYFSLVDDKDIIYTALCESEFPLKQAQTMLNRIKRELKNMPDYNRQSVNSIQTFAKTFIVPIIAEIDKENSLKRKEEQVVEVKKIITKEEVDKQIKQMQEKPQQQQGKSAQVNEGEVTIIEFNEEDDDNDDVDVQDDIEEEKQADQDMQDEDDKNYPNCTQEALEAQENNMNDNNNGQAIQEQSKDNLEQQNTDREREENNRNSPFQSQNHGNHVEHPCQIKQAAISVKNNRRSSKNIKHRRNELSVENYSSTNSNHPGIFASTNGQYDPHKELLTSINGKETALHVREQVTKQKIVGKSNAINSDSQINQEINISAPLDSAHFNGRYKSINLQEKGAYSSCREINCSMKEVDQSGQGQQQRKLSQTCSLHHQNQDFYLDDIQIQIDKSHKFCTESSAHPSNFSTADNKHTADMLVLKQLKIKDSCDINELQEYNDVKQHNKEEIEKMQEKQMKNAATLRSIKIKIIASIVVLSVVLSITLPLIK